MIELNNSNILIVGGAGFVGSNLTKMVLRDGKAAHVTVVDNLMSSQKENLPDDSKLKFIEGSITDQAVLDQLSDDLDYVFHLSTYHGNQSSIHDPLADHENNTFTTLRLFEKLKTFSKVKKVVYSSAGCSVAKKTFDDPTATTEEDPIELYQDSPYSISKIIGEFYSVYYHKQHQLPTVRARFQNVFGPGEVLGAGQWRGTPATVWRNVTPTFIYRALNKMALPVENSGNASRDFIFVEDICRGLIACATKGTPGGVYNIASGKEMSIMDLATTINKIAGNDTPLELLPKRPWDNSGKRFGSTDKSKKELGFECITDFDEGLLKTIEWTKTNLPFIQSCMDKHKDKMSK